MAAQRFRPIKIDPNDTLYSKIIRWGHTRCLRCGRTRKLQCCHIMGRGRHSTRFMLKPLRNAIPLCTDCHDWFDTHKIIACICEPEKRVFNPKDESYHFLVSLGYTWGDLERLLFWSRQTKQYNHFCKLAVAEMLKATWDRLNRREK